MRPMLSVAFVAVAAAALLLAPPADAARLLQQLPVEPRASGNTTNNDAPVLIGPVIISEFVSNPGPDSIPAPGSADSTDWIELYNNATQPVDLEGWVLSDNKDPAQGWTMPSRALQPAEYLLVYVTGLDVSGPGPNGTLVCGAFGLNKAGERLYLFDPQGTLISSTGRVPEQEEGYSFGLPGTAPEPNTTALALPGLHATAASAAEPLTATEFAFLLPTPGGPNTAQVQVNSTAANLA